MNREKTRTASSLNDSVLRVVAFYRQHDALAPERQEGRASAPRTRCAVARLSFWVFGYGSEADHCNVIPTSSALCQKRTFGLHGHAQLKNSILYREWRTAGASRPP